MTRTQTGNPVSQIRASDADRDAVLAQLSEHFQAGRLTADELGDRTGRALGARTIGDLDALMTDLPVPERDEPGRQPMPRSGAHPALGPVVLALIAIATAGSVLAVGTGHRGWSAWWVIPVALIIARRLAGRRGIGPEGRRDQR